MRSLFILSALFVAAIATPPGGRSLPGGNNANQNQNLHPQIIPRGQGGYSRQQYGAGNNQLDDGQTYNNQLDDGQTYNNQAAPDQGASATGGQSVSTNNGVPVQGGSPVIIPGHGGASNNNNNGYGAGLGAGGQGGASNNNNNGYGAGLGAGGDGGNSNGAVANDAPGSPFADPGQGGASFGQAGGAGVNQALLSNQALTSSSMSAGAIAGIAVGVLAVAALGTAIAVVVLRR